MRLPFPRETAALLLGVVRQLNLRGLLRLLRAVEHRGVHYVRWLGRVPFVVNPKVRVIAKLRLRLLLLHLGLGDHGLLVLWVDVQCGLGLVEALESLACLAVVGGVPPHAEGAGPLRHEVVMRPVLLLGVASVAYYLYSRSLYRLFLGRQRDSHRLAVEWLRHRLEVLSEVCNAHVRFGGAISYVADLVQ